MIEIEYKYKINHDDARNYINSVIVGKADNDQLISVTAIEQYYIIDDNKIAMRVRVSRDGNGRSNVLAIKSANPGVARMEIEKPLSNQEADGLIELAVSGLKKTRYVIQVDGAYNWEFDVFHDKLEGTVYAEIEVKAEGDRYTMPTCSGMELVTGREHSNAHLASCVDD